MAKKERKNMNRVVEFLQPYSTKQIGDTLNCNLLLASRLVNSGVAKYSEAIEEVQPKPSKNKNKNKKQK